MQEKWSDFEPWSDWMHWAESNVNKSDEWKDEQIRLIAVGGINVRLLL